MSQPPPRTPEPVAPRITPILAEIAAKSPAPGGGAVAALLLAQAAALARMVIAYSLGKRDLEPHQAALNDADAALGAITAAAAELADADADAFSDLSRLWKLPPDDPARAEQMPAAVRAAAAVPTKVLEHAAQTLGLIQTLVGTTNPRLISDLAVAAAAAEAAAASAAWNIRINLPDLRAHAGETEAAEAEHLAADLTERAARLRTEIETNCAT